MLSCLHLPPCLPSTSHLKPGSPTGRGTGTAILAFAAAASVAPAASRLPLAPVLRPKVVGALMMFMVQSTEELESWELRDSGEEDIGEVTARDCAEACLDVLALEVGNPVFQVAMPALVEMTASEDWKVRHAALYGYSLIGGQYHTLTTKARQPWQPVQR